MTVHRRGRRKGLGTRLMQGIEDAAEQLYRRIGWTPAGAIPGYPLDPDGTPHDAVLFYEEMGTRP